MTVERRLAPTRNLYSCWQVVDTRWRDNDIYGHVNNAVYYSYIDSVINGYMVDHGVLDPMVSEVIGVVVESHCEFHKPLSYPDKIDCGLRLEYLGSSSARYEVGMFLQGEDQAAAVGGFTHVFVGRLTGRPLPIPDSVRDVLKVL